MCCLWKFMNDRYGSVSGSGSSWTMFVPPQTEYKQWILIRPAAIVLGTEENWSGRKLRSTERYLGHSGQASKRGENS